MAVKLSAKENAVERELRRRVVEQGGRCEKVTVLGSRGFFDRLIVLPGGRIIFCEVKRPKGGRVRAHQWGYAQEYRGLGLAVALITCSEDIDRLLMGAFESRQV